MGEALSGCLNITAFVLTFSVLLRILTLSGLMELASALLAALLAPLGFDRVWAGRLLTGLLELASGVSSLTDGTPARRLSMAAFMLGWAGLSVHCQVLAFLGDSGLSLRPYFLGKLLHSCLSSCFILFFVYIFHLEGEPACFLPLEAPETLDFYGTFVHFTSAAWLFWTGMMIFSSFTAKYAIVKRRRL